MQLYTRMDQESCVISLDGELDAASSIVVDKALETVMQREQKYILVNFTLLTYISAAGIGAFIYHQKRIKDRKKVLVCYNMSASIHNIFTLTGLHEIIPIVDSEEEAHMWCQQKTCQ
jgi:anti-sigma B factor antagonist